MNPEIPRQSTRRDDKRGGDGAELVRLQVLLRDCLSIRIIDSHLQLLVRDHLDSLFPQLIQDSLIVNRLGRPVDGAVRKNGDIRPRIVIGACASIVRIAIEGIGVRRQEAVITVRKACADISPLAREYDLREARRIGGCLRQDLRLPIVSLFLNRQIHVLLRCAALSVHHHIIRDDILLLLSPAGLQVEEVGDLEIHIMLRYRGQFDTVHSEVEGRQFDDRIPQHAIVRLCQVVGERLRLELLILFYLISVQ